MSNGIYMAYSPSPSAPHSPHIGGGGAAAGGICASALVEQEKFVGEWLTWLYKDVTQRLQANNFLTLPEAHACTAGLKSLTTSATADGIEDCRKLCGGHGYLCGNGLPELFAVYVPACTYEGDNTVLLLQVARFLMKNVSQLGTGKQPGGTIAYMGRIEHLMQSRCNVQKWTISWICHR